MKKNMFWIKLMAGALLACLLGIVAFSVSAEASEASAVAIGVTDYEEQTMEIIRNGNTIIYASVNNKKTWEEVGGTIIEDKMIMNIGFADKEKNVDVWLKGDKDSRVIKVTIPKASSSFKAKYDRATGRFEMSGYDNYTQFRWKKYGADAYKRVDISPNSESNKAFCREIETLTYKGGKIIIGLEGKKGIGIDDMGERPCKEVLITIPKKASAPNIKINTTKLTFNTRETMEYQVIGSGSTWKACKKNMTLTEIAPAVLVENGAKNVSIKFRTAATSSKPASLECFVTVKAQRTGPSIGKSGDVIVEAATGKNEGKTAVTFIGSTKTTPMEYKIVKPGDKVDITKGWSGAKTDQKAVYFTAKKLPKGSQLLVRYKKINANANKNIEAELPSAYTTYTVG